MIGAPLYRIAVSHTAATCTVTMAGELDMAGHAEMQHTLFDEVAGAHGRNLVIDMAGVTFLDSTAISALVAAYQHAQKAGVPITVARPSPQVARVLQMTGLLELFTGGVGSNTPS